MSKKTIVKWHNSTFLVSGFGRAIIYDFDRGARAVPLGLVKFVESIIDKPLYTALALMAHDNANEMEEYYSFLINEEYIFHATETASGLFVHQKEDWHYPALITNAILYFEEYNLHLIKSRLSLIEEINCRHIRLVFENIIDRQSFNKLLELLEQLHIDSVELVLPFDNYSLKQLNKLTLKLSKIVFIKSKTHEKTKQSNTQIIYTKNSDYVSDIKSNLQLNKQLYFESLKYNNYFNRKLFIDHHGNIKNEINSSKAFGNVDELENKEDLIKIIHQPEFQKCWSVKKDMIDVCKHCEFRYMCVDNRLPVMRKNGTWFHNTECEYNPYINKWNDEEGYKNLDDSGITCKPSNFSINQNKLDEINSTIWNANNN